MFARAIVPLSLVIVLSPGDYPLSRVIVPLSRVVSTIAGDYSPHRGDPLWMELSMVALKYFSLQQNTPLSCQGEFG